MNKKTIIIVLHKNYPADINLLFQTLNVSLNFRLYFKNNFYSKYIKYIIYGYEQENVDQKVLDLYHLSFIKKYVIIQNKYRSISRTKNKTKFISKQRKDLLKNSFVKNRNFYRNYSTFRRNIH